MRPAAPLPRPQIRSIPVSRLNESNAKMMAVNGDRVTPERSRQTNDCPRAGRRTRQNVTDHTAERDAGAKDSNAYRQRNELEDAGRRRKVAKNSPASASVGRTLVNSHSRGLPPCRFVGIDGLSHRCRVR